MFTFTFSHGGEKDSPLQPGGNIRESMKRMKVVGDCRSSAALRMRQIFTFSHGEKIHNGRLQSGGNI